MQISYNPNVPAPAVLNEIKYYMPCSVLKSLMKRKKSATKTSAAPMLL